MSLLLIKAKTKDFLSKPNLVQLYKTGNAPLYMLPKSELRQLALLPCPVSGTNG
jgi:hypothetical protein